MPRFYNNIDVNGNQIQNAVIQPLASDPATPATAQIWFHNTAGGDSQGRLKVKLGTRTLIIDDQYVSGVTVSGVLLNGGTSLAPSLSVQAADSTHDGYLSSALWTRLNGATSADTASTLVLRDASGNAAFNMITISGTPVNGTDAINKNYADAIAAGFDPKGSVVLATTQALPACTYANGSSGVGATLTCNANSALTTALIDGTSTYTLTSGDRVLVKNQATTLQNGIYTVTSLGSGSTPWVLTRATDFNTAASGPGKVSSGAFTFVETGANVTTQWIMSTAGTIVMGTTGLVFTQFGAGSTYTNGDGLTLSGNTFSVNLTGTTTLEFNSGALRLKSSANSGAPLLSGGTGNEPAYGALNLAGGSNVVTGILPKANGGLGVDASTGLTANTVLAAPNGASGAASFRALVAADLPSGVVTVGTYPKVTVDTYGRVTAGSSLAATDIPNLDFAKITTGIVPLSQGGTGLNLTKHQDAPAVLHVPVRVVATSNITISSPGATINGIAMSAGDRVLLTAQTTGSQNGLWVWNASASAMTRPTDYPAAGTVQAFYGMEVEVLAGSSYAGTCWYISTTGAITIDTTSVTFTQRNFSVSSGVTGILPVANGGTGSSTASGALTALGAAGAKSGTITGDSSTKNFVVTSGLDSAKVKVTVVDSTLAEVYPDIEYTSNTTFTIKFAVAPTTGVTFGWRATG